MYTHSALQFLLALAVTAVLTACGQSTSPPVGNPPGGSPPTTAPYSVALGCVTDRRRDEVAEYKPEGETPDRIITEAGGQGITAMAYDLSGNLFIGINTTSDSWVDEYTPGSTTSSRHISDGIHHPGSMVADPNGNLYVANIGILGGDVVMYKPGSTKPDLDITTTSYPAGLAFYNGLLWVSDYNLDRVVAYEQSSTRIKHKFTDDLHGPTVLSETKGNLYVENDPFIGTDYVREYGIPKDKPPYFARTIYPRLHLLNTIATDADENVYLSELQGDDRLFGFSKWNRNGEEKYFNADIRSVSIVASPQTTYVAEGKRSGSILLYTKDGARKGSLKPANCELPFRLAIMQPQV